MNAWVEQLADLLAGGERVVAVTVVGVRGSAPREPGARMLVTEAETIGTIGGGQLEHQCTRLAVDALHGESRLRLERFPLGASMGQCCGGVVEVLFETFDEGLPSWLKALVALSGQRTPAMFLGSGLYDLKRMREAGVKTGLATDVGGGTCLSMLRTMGDAYKVLQLNGQVLSPAEALYLATLGAAEALGIDTHVGNFAAGKEADFVILDPAATRLSAHRDAHTTSLEERLFVLTTLGDDRHVAATAVKGRLTRPA